MVELLIYLYLIVGATFSILFGIAAISNPIRRSPSLVLDIILNLAASVTQGIFWPVVLIEQWRSKE